MAVFQLQQTNTAAQDGVIAACSGGSTAPTTQSSQIANGGSAGSGGVTVTITKNTTQIGFTLQSIPNQPNWTVWPSGNYVVRLNVTTANSNITWEDCYICRVNSSGVNQATVGSLTGQAISCSTTGVKTMTISGSQQSAASTDELYIVCIFKNANMSSNQSIAITRNQLIDMPRDQTISPNSISSAESVSSPSVINPLYYVNTASTAGGSGRTTATSGADRAFATLSEAEANAQQNAGGYGDIIITCMGSAADTTVFTLSGWNVGTITIKTDSGYSNSVHGGKWNTSSYRLVVSTNSANVNIQEPGVTLDGLQLSTEYASSGGTARCISGGLGSNGTLIVKNCILRGDNAHSAPSTHAGIYWEKSLKISNCAIYGFDKISTSYGMQLTPGSGETCYVYHNSIVNSSVAIRAATTANAVTAKNNIVKTATTAYEAGVSFNSNSDWNVSSTSTSLGTNGIANATINFKNESAIDLHLEGKRSHVFVNNNLYSDSNLAITLDIDRQNYPSTGSIVAGADYVQLIDLDSQGIATTSAFGSPTITQSGGLSRKL